MEECLVSCEGCQASQCCWDRVSGDEGHCNCSPFGPQEQNDEIVPLSSVLPAVQDPGGTSPT